MSWTRLDDTWTDSTVLADLDFADRWHYLAMIQFCSRTEKVDGVLRVVDARRCSDHPDPNQAVRNLADVGLVEIRQHDVKLNLIDDHLPPPSVRNRKEAQNQRKSRSRAHQVGNHSHCIPENCDRAPKREVTSDVTRDPGTGQDRTGRDRSLDREGSSVQPQSVTDQPVTSWPVVSIPNAVPSEQSEVQEFPTDLPPIRCHFFGCDSTDLDDSNLCSRHRPDGNAMDEFERTKRDQFAAREAHMKEAAA